MPCKEGWWIFVLLIFFMWPVIFLVTMMKRWLFSRGGIWQHLTLLSCPPEFIFFTYILQSTRIRHLVMVICKFWDFVGLFFSAFSFLCVPTASGTLLCCSSWSIFQFVFPYLNRLQSPLRQCDLWCMWWRNTFFLHYRAGWLATLWWSHFVSSILFFLNLNTYNQREGNTHSGPPDLLSAHPLQWHCALCRGTDRRLYTWRTWEWGMTREHHSSPLHFHPDSKWEQKIAWFRKEIIMHIGYFPFAQ